MRRDESASTLSTPPIPIKTMFLASVTPTGPHSPQHLLTTAIHTYTSTSESPDQAHQHYMRRSSAAQNPTSDHVLLTPYVVKGFERRRRGGGRREAKRKATCTLCILGRPVSVTQHTEGTQRQEDRCSVCLSESLGWWSWEIKGV